MVLNRAMILGLAMIAVSCVIALAALRAPETPGIELSPKEIVLQDVLEGEKEPIYIVVTNNSSKPVSLTRVSPTCKCIQRTETSQPVPASLSPGENLSLAFEINTFGIGGKIDQAVCVEYALNGEQQQRYACVPIRGIAQVVLRPSPTSITWKNVTLNSEKTEQVDLLSMLPRGSVELIDWGSESEALKMEFAPSQEVSTVTSQRAEKLASLTLTSNINDLTNDSLQKTIINTKAWVSYRHRSQTKRLVIPIEIEAVPDLTVFPRALVVDASAPSKQLTREVGIRFSEQGVSSLRLESAVDGVSVLTNAVNGDEKDWKVTISGSTRSIAAAKLTGFNFIASDGRKARVSVDVVDWGQ